MATTAVFVVAAVAVAAVLAAVALNRRRSPTTPEGSEQLVRAVDEMRLRMDSLAQDLSEALDRAERESRRNRLFGELGGTVDLEELMDRVLDAAMEIPGIEAAMMVVEAQGGNPAAATRGMTAQEMPSRPRSTSSKPKTSRRAPSPRSRTRVGTARRGSSRRRTR